MHTQNLIFTSLILISGCKSIPCLLGLTPGDASCNIPTPAACPEGQLRDFAGECRAPEGNEFDTDVNVDDTPEESDTPVETGESDTVDTETVQPDRCDYQLSVLTDNWPREIGMRVFNARETVVFEFFPGDLVNTFTLYDFDLNLPAGMYTFFAIDSAEDGWGSGYFELTHVSSGRVASTGTCEGGVTPYEVNITCARP
jgi:hypothetical protein